jgi:quercetin dioxygenase-like cupin family protein
MADEARELALDADDIGLLGGALKAQPMDANLRERLRTRILERAAGIQVVRADAGQWTPLVAGISIKRLRVDAARGNETTLWRLDVGAVIPPHAHQDDEECLVLEGSIIQDGIEYGAGDYLHALPGSRHSPLSAPRGALLLIRSQSVEHYLRAR